MASPREIAHRLKLSVKTTRPWAAVMSRLAIRDVAGLVRYALGRAHLARILILPLVVGQNPTEE
jgi:hypothetical protein